MQRHSMAEWLFKRKSLFLDLTIRCSPTGDHLSQNCWPLSGVSRTPQCKAPMQHTPCALWQFVLHCCYLQWADVASCHSSSVQWWLHGMRSWLALCRKCFQLVLKELKTLCWKYPMHQNVPSVSKSHLWSTGSPYINKQMWEWNWQPLGPESGNSTQWHVQEGLQPMGDPLCSRDTPEGLCPVRDLLLRKDIQGQGSWSQCRVVGTVMLSVRSHRPLCTRQQNSITHSAPIACATCSWREESCL